MVRGLIEAREGYTIISCFSGDTEVLTKEGWQRLDNLPKGVKVAEYDTTSKEISFSYPLKYIHNKNEEVYHYEDRAVSIKATKTHNVLTQYDNRPIRKQPFGEVNFSGANCFLNAGVYENSSKESELFTRILAMFNADGSMSERGFVTFLFSKERKINRCRKLLEDYGVDFSENVFFSEARGFYTVFYVGKRLNNKLLEYTDRSKTLKWSCLDTLPMKVYVEESIHWDGNKNKNAFRVSTTNRQSADVFQTMCNLSGIRCRLSVRKDKRYNKGAVYYLNFNIHKPKHKTFMKDKWSFGEPSIEDTYCVTMPKGTLLIRHNDKISIQGNCDYSQAELRVASWFSGDENMQEAYNSGSDLHQSTLNLIYGDNVIDPEVDHDGAKRQRTVSKACFSGDTEILTKRGFVRFDNYDGIEEVAQYNADTQEISYVRPYDFRMIPNTPVCSFENENTSLRLTPNHECLVVNAKGNVVKQSFESLAGHEQTKYKWINAGYYQYDKSLFIDDKLTRLLASFVADGSYISTMTTVRWGFTKKRKADRLKYLLDALSIPYRYQKEGSLEVNSFYVDDFNTLSLLKRFCSRDKTLSDYALTELNPIVYLEEARYWDGYVNHTQLIQVSSTNKRTLEIMQIMAIQSGIRARLIEKPRQKGNKQVIYLLSYNFNKSPYSAFISSSIDTRTHHHATHNVWCVTVPEHNIVIRRNGKVSIQGNCNFGLVYGAMPQTLQDFIKQKGIDISLEEAQELHKAFFKAYPELKSFYTRCKNFTRRYGYIESPIGRKRWLPDIYSNNWKLKSGAERQCVNTPVQGMASDICISALADIVFDETLDHSKFNVLGSVHDAILIECKEEYAEELGEKVAAIMSNPSVLTNAGLTMPIPLKADLVINKTWGD